MPWRLAKAVTTFSESPSICIRPEPWLTIAKHKGSYLVSQQRPGRERDVDVVLKGTIRRDQDLERHWYAVKRHRICLGESGGSGKRRASLATDTSASKACKVQ
ncbi:hypothetical protein ACKVV1_008177 [Pyricularia oryzae]